MDISITSSVSNAILSSSEDQSIGIAVLKKALDAEATTASALLNALPPIQPSSNLPPNLGKHIDTTA